MPLVFEPLIAKVVIQSILVVWFVTDAPLYLLIWYMGSTQISNSSTVPKQHIKQQ